MTCPLRRVRVGGRNPEIAAITSPMNSDFSQNPKYIARPIHAAGPADGDVHKYFSPYDSPYEAYINFMNVLDNIRTRVGE